MSQLFRIKYKYQKIVNDSSDAPVKAIAHPSDEIKTAWMAKSVTMTICEVRIQYKMDIHNERTCTFVKDNVSNHRNIPLDRKEWLHFQPLQPEQKIRTL